MNPEYFYRYANGNSMDGIYVDALIAEFKAHRAMQRLDAEIIKLFEEIGS